MGWAVGHMILRGKGITKVAVIMAYNVCQKYHMEGGERTAYKQQLRLLSSKIRKDNLPKAPHPCRQFILDLQSWLEQLLHSGHEIILTMDANENYNPDVPGSIHHLNFFANKLTMDKGHDGKLSTLIATCGLKDP